MEKNLIPELLDALRSHSLYTKLGLGAERIIKSRTRKGLDVKGSAFTDYSAGHLKKRKQAGITQASKVNLVFSPNFGMLASINHAVANNLESVAIQFENPEKEQLAVYHNITGAGKSRVKREFWGIELQEEIDKLADIGYNEIKDIIFKQLPDK